MRYRDQPTAQVETRVAAPPDAVWALVTDPIATARYSPECQGTEWLNGADAVAVGAQFQGRNQHEALGEWTTTATVTEVEPGRRWVYEVRAGENRMAFWGFEVDPTSDGGSIVRHFARMGPDPSGLSIAIDSMPDREGRIVSHRLREWEAGMTAVLDGVKAEAESAN